MNKQEIILTGEGGYSLSVAVFAAKDPKASFQIVHGMEEHKERYYELATYLSEHGYNVIVSDLRGHGENAPLLSHIADKNGYELLLKDQRDITEYIQKRFANLPIVLFGHSMGSMIVRDILQLDSKKYAKAIICGYVNPNPASPVAVLLGNIVGLFKKPTKHSKLLTSLAVGPFTKSVKDRKTDLDWLSYNEQNVQNYIADPLCGVEFTVGSYKVLFKVMNEMAKVKNYKDVNSDMPFLLIAGEDDPCSGGEKGRAKSKEVLQKAGFKNLEVHTFKNMRHEILNEDDKNKVIEAIYNFLEK